jgi:hypothetical protein
MESQSPTRMTALEQQPRNWPQALERLTPS